MTGIAGLLQSLVRAPSVNPMGRPDLDPAILFENRVVDILEAHLRAAGAHYTRIEVAPGRDNITATYTPATATTHLLFESHTDTVPVDGMTIPPFGGTIENGKLFGRGACDVKAGVTAILTAFLRLVREKPATNAAVTVAFTVDEEHTFLGVQHLCKHLPKVDFAVVAEPTSLDIVTSHKGVARWTTTVRGTACHSSKPHEGDNAIYRMRRIIEAIEDYARVLHHGIRHPVLGSPSISVGMIRGGTSANVVPDHCEIEVDRRINPGTSAEAAMNECDERIRQHLGRDGFPFESRLDFACQPLIPVASTNPNLQRLVTAIESTGRTPELLGVPYGTDAAALAEAGVPSVVFGPGSIAQAHTKDEWVDIGEVATAAEILYRMAVPN